MVHKLTGAVNAVSSTVAVGVTVARPVTATVNTVSLTASVGLTVVRPLTRTGTAASATAGGDLRVARQVTGAVNVASAALGDTLLVNTGFVLVATASVGSATPTVGLTVIRPLTRTGTAASNAGGGDLRIARPVTGAVNVVSLTPAALLYGGAGVQAAVNVASQTAGAVLVVEHRLTSHPAAFSAVGGTDLVRAWGLTVALTVDSETATATFERVWLFQAEAVTVTPDLPLSLLRRPSVLCLSASATVDSAALVLNRAMTGLVPAQSVTPAASLTRHLDLAFTADLASLSPLVDWVIGRPLSGFCAVETLTPDSEGFTVERLLTLFLACATATPSAHFLFAEQTMHGRARLHFSARSPVLTFRVRHG